MHGTPEEFKSAIKSAIGVLSFDEAVAAIDEYRRDWYAAESALESASRSLPDPED